MTKAESKVSAVVWEEPELDYRDKYDWAKIATQLRARPGEWAKIFDQDRVSVANSVRGGSVAVVSPDEGFEFKTRNNVRKPERACTLYMRWVPDGGVK